MSRSSVGVAGVQIEPVDPLEVLDLGPCVLGERGLALERMQHDALEQIAQADVVQLGEGLEDLE